MRHARKLEHKNIVKLEGFAFTKDLNAGMPRAIIFSSWAGGGIVTQYVRKHPTCDLVKLVRVCL